MARPQIRNPKLEIRNKLQIPRLKCFKRCGLRLFFLFCDPMIGELF